ncbi:threonine synthase-like 2 [Amia ocellicauda]|uniref:threonine synthase-like 2 n=1 Tax=Amia ocellicauda TaxID=2972642 RepID=UPI003463EDD2|nr:THNS2 protein [Amia calva]
MRYCSTRGGVVGQGFREVLLSGYAQDGGMFMPEEIPTVPITTLRQWVALPYPALVQELCALFIPSEEIPRDQLDALLSRALAGFSVPGAVQMSQLGGGLVVLELWHGPTLAFKDLAMSCCAQLISHCLSSQRRHTTVLVGTSGDTGSSAIHSVCGLQGIDILVLFPKGGCSAVQERQMTTVLEDNVHVFAAEGSSDEIDVHLRRLFSDPGFSQQHGLLSLNSVNWARLMVQLAHFFYAYLQCHPTLDTLPLPTLEVVVPTGGAGNITAGCIAMKMGLPLKLVAMVNDNDIVRRMVQTGLFSMASKVCHTLAPAIDIQDPYNMERVFWLLSGGDSVLVRGLMEEFHSTGRVRLPDTLHRELCAVLHCDSVSDTGIVDTMRRCWEESHYLLCPHTAVAVWHHYHCPLRPGETRCCLATASPEKFQEAVLKAGLTPNIPPKIRALETMSTRFELLTKGEDWEAVLREKIKSIYRSRQTRVSTE